MLIEVLLRLFRPGLNSPVPVGTWRLLLLRECHFIHLELLSVEETQSVLDEVTGVETWTNVICSW